MRWKEVLLDFIGVLMVVVGIIDMLFSLFSGKPSLVLWFCYSGSILMGASVLFRSRLLLLSQLNILLIPAIIWNVDFFYLLFFEGSFLGIADYFFTEPPFAQLISLQHAYNILLALVAFYFLLNKSKSANSIKNAWRISFVQALIFFILSRFLGSREENVNWVYRIQISLQINIPDFYYIFIWFGGVLLMIVLTQYILTRWKELKNSP